jgi:hypothetical protein
MFTTVKTTISASFIMMSKKDITVDRDLVLLERRMPTILKGSASECGTFLPQCTG